MSEYKNECTRKTIYISEELVKKAEILFGSAGVDSFSSFAVKAIEHYINAIVMENTSGIITKEMRKAIRDEVSPIASRLSKGLFRYAVELDMLTQLLAYLEADADEEVLERIRRFANERMAKTKGKVDIKSIMDDGWEGDGYDPFGYNY